MDRLLRDLRAVIEDADISRNYITRARRSKARALKVMDESSRVLSNLKGSSPSQNAFNLSISRIFEEAPEIMKEEIEVAVSRNDEFAYFAFLNPLLEVADQEGLYEITSRGTGWSRNISVNLAMNEIAGTIDDYAQGVEGARAALNVGKGKDARKASEIWRKNIYPGRSRTGPYSLTIGLRLEISSSLAPFWSLLNDGNKVMMASDRGGTPYPSKGPTRFVQKTEERIYKRFREIFISYREQNKSDIKTLQEYRNYLKELIKDIDYIIEQIASNLDIVKMVARSLGKKMADLDANKLLTILDRIQSGELSTGIVNIGPRGRRLRVSVSRLSGIEY